MTKAELKTLQSLPLELKIEKTKARIREWYYHWGGNVYISFSGGKDSTVLLDIVRKEFPGVPAVFVDTGLEYPEIKEFVKTFKNVEIIKPQVNFTQVIKDYGYPVISKEVSNVVYYAKKESNWALKAINGLRTDIVGGPSEFRKQFVKYKYLLHAPFPVSSRCCYLMKKKPIYVYENKTDKKGFVGVLACESKIREQSYLKTGCNSFTTNKSNPLGFWTEQDILKYIYYNKLSIAKVYGDVIPNDLFCQDFSITGLQRTGCMFCMFGVHLEKGKNRFQRMRTTHPQIYDYCIRDSGLGLGKVLDFIGVEYK